MKAQVPCITRAHPGHAAGIADVQVRSWQAAYAGIVDDRYLAGMSVEQRTRGWQEILAGSRSRTLIAADNTRVIGFVSHGPWRDAEERPDQGEIWALYALPEVWGTGVGRALLTAALAEQAREGRQQVFLWVLKHNSRGIRFYRCGGFLPVEGSVKSFELGGTLVEELCMQWWNSGIAGVSGSHPAVSVTDV